MTWKLFLTAFVTTLLCQPKCTVSSTQCFNCSTLLDYTCSDPFSTRGRTPFTCSRGGSCVKVKTDSEVRRGCMQTTGVQTDAMHYGQEGICVSDLVSPSFETRIVCRCHTNLCNTASNLEVGISVVAFVVFTSILIWAT